MKRTDFEQKQYEESIQAGMNQRYHQAMASRWGWWDQFFRILTGLLTVAGAMLAVTAFSNSADAWATTSLVAAILAAIIGVVLNVLPFADWHLKHLDLFRRWSDLREEIEALLFAGPDEAAIERLKALDAKSHRLCAIEPVPNDSLLRKCYTDELRSRGCLPEVEAVPELATA